MILYAPVLPRKRVRAARIAKAAKKPVDEVVKREKPSFELDDADEAALTTEQRALIEAIRKALDEDDHKTVLALVQKLQKAKEWPDGIPLPIRRAALEAVSWIGMSALPEIAGFLGDGDKEVVADAIEAYESALIEANGDRELSAVVTAASGRRTSSTLSRGEARRSLSPSTSPRAAWPP